MHNFQTDMERINNNSSEHYTFSHYNENGEKVFKSKIGYDTEIEAIKIARKRNLQPETIHKYVAYKCSICGKWHIGKHKNRLLTEKDREKYRKQEMLSNGKINTQTLNYKVGIFKTVVLSAQERLILERNLKFN